MTDPKRSLLPPLTAVDEGPYTPGAKSRPPLTGDPSSLVSLWPKLAGAREGQYVERGATVFRVIL